MKRRLSIIIPAMLCGALAFAPQAAAEPVAQAVPAPVPDPVSLAVDQFNQATQNLQNQVNDFVAALPATPVFPVPMPAPMAVVVHQPTVAENSNNTKALTGDTGTVSPVGEARSHPTKGIVKTVPAGTIAPTKGIEKTTLEKPLEPVKGIPKNSIDQQPGLDKSNPQLSPGLVEKTTNNPAPYPVQAQPVNPGTSDQQEQDPTIIIQGPLPGETNPLIKVPRRSDGPNYHW